ncbi:MAG TPA: BON domain-containing protein [Longimicrobium sp.]
MKRSGKVWAAMAIFPLAAGCSVLGGGETANAPQLLLERTTRDTRIRSEIERRFAAEPSIGAGRVRVEVDGGQVQLHGSVAGLGALRCAETNAELTSGVILVIDFLVLQPGPSTARCIAPRVVQAAS